MRYRAALHVVHAEPRLPPALARHFSAVAPGKPGAALASLVAALRDAGVDAHAHSAHGERVEALSARARALAADLIVVGTRGGTVLSAMLGSTAERLVGRGRQRVLLVRRPNQRAYRQVMIAASGHSRLAEQVAAARFVSPERPAVLHAYEAPLESSLTWHGASAGELRSYRDAAGREAELSMGKLMAAAGLEPSQLVLRQGAPSKLLERFDPDSLLVLSRGKSSARRLLFGSVTRAVIAHGRSDLLLV